MFTVKSRTHAKELAISRQAAEWLLTLETDDETAQQAFVNWITESPDNVAAFLDAASVDTLCDEIDFGPDEGALIESEPTRRRPQPLAASVAAIGVLLLVLWQMGLMGSWDHYVTAVGETRTAPRADGSLRYLKPPAPVPHSSPVGGYAHISLDDGSVLHLNTNTSVRVLYTAARRQIFLDRGEVLLSVVHDPSRPLEVIASHVVTRAIGTKFSVRLYENANVEALVTEGRVLVLRKPTTLGIPAEPKPLVRTLVAGERVLVDSRAAYVSRLSEEDIKRTLQWTTGHISFRDEKLSSVVAEVNRYSGRQLVILNPRLAGTKIGGAFDTARADTYAEDLMRFFGPSTLGSTEPAAAPAQ